MRVLAANKGQGGTIFMDIRRARRIMVLAPHPDDEVLGCGGSLAWHTHQGAEVTVIYMTSGEAGGGNISDQALVRKTREQEASSGAAILGINNLYYLRFKDGSLEYNSANIKQLATLIRQLQPDIIYAPHATDTHPDHRCCHALTVSAIARASDRGKWPYGGQTWEPQLMLGYEILNPLPVYDHVQDITQFMGLKIKALECHRSQLQATPYDEAIVGLNRYRGITSTAGSFCECFLKYWESAE